MRNLVRVAFATVVLVGSLYASRLAVPSPTVACSCARPVPLRALVGEADAVVVSGTIAAIDPGSDNLGHTVGQFVIEHIFQGPALPNPLPIVGGGGGDCTVAIEAGWQVVMVASFAEGRLQPNVCGHFELLTTPEGQGLLQEVVAVFGAGPGPPIDDSGGPAVDLASVAILLVVGVVVVVLFGVLIAVFGRRTRAAP